MGSLAILQSLKESILTGNVKAVFGDPISAQGKTVIPVAKIIYGYGRAQVLEGWVHPAQKAREVEVEQ